MHKSSVLAIRRHLHDQLASIPPEERTGKIESAFNLLEFILMDYLDGITGVESHLRVNSRGDVVSGIQYRATAPGVVKVELLASLVPGEGSYWMGEMDKLARSRKSDIVLEALDPAIPFYLKKGFSKTGARIHGNHILRKDYVKPRRTPVVSAKSDSLSEERWDDVGALAVNIQFLSSPAWRRSQEVL
jgi:hypothetical protein